MDGVRGPRAKRGGAGLQDRGFFSFLMLILVSSEMRGEAVAESELWGDRRRGYGLIHISRRDASLTTAVFIRSLQLQSSAFFLAAVLAFAFNSLVIASM
jgi:hypothetical protein